MAYRARTGAGPAAVVVVSAVQLAAGLAGLGVALRRRRHYDVWLPQRLDLAVAHGSPHTVGRDALWMGTAYSAPAAVLAVQAWATARAAAGTSGPARRVIGLIGAALVPGYLVERSVRTQLRPGGWDPVETPVVAVGLAGAAAMAVLGHRGQSGRRP